MTDNLCPRGCCCTDCSPPTPATATAITFDLTRRKALDWEDRAGRKRATQARADAKRKAKSCEG